MTKKICCFCGKRPAVTDDHVPPRNIFLGRYRSGKPNLITVPACVKCNNEYTKDDEYFRDALLFQAYKYSTTAKELWDEKSIRGINKPEAFKYKKSILSRLIDFQIVTPSGIYLGNATGIVIDSERIKTIIKKIAQGLYYYTTKSILPIDSTYKIEFKQWHPEIIRQRNVIKKERFNYIRENIFKYLIEFNQDKNQFFLWLVFFECVDFWVWCKINSPSLSTPPST